KKENLLIDLKQIEEKAQQKKNKALKIKKPIKFLAYILVFLFIACALFFINANVSEQDSSSWLNQIPIIKQFKYLVESADKKLKGEDKDRINILLLGMGGKNHEGGYLTDTIMLASLKPSNKKLALLSIPRDLTIPMENMGWRKINNVNAYAEAENFNSGGLAMSQAISDTLNLPIDYYARIDFVGFEKIIDELGGIKICADNTLDDYAYPAKGMETTESYEDRFEHLHIEKGWQKMNGELALKYARSRHALGAEGSDFARARRQQKILQAVKDKILSLRILFKPKLIAGIINDLQEHVSTNLKVWEMVKLWEISKNIKTDSIISKVLDNGPSGLLMDIITNEGAYILTPRSGDFTEIQYLVNNIFFDAPVETKTKVAAENILIEVRNGTWINGLANKVTLDLEKFGFNIIRIGNCSRQNFQKSVIYDLTYGKKIQSLAILKDKTKANVSFGLPQWLIDDLAEELAKEKNPKQPDFILILGQDADSSASGAENVEK
ncbi:MAG: LCP family protein, partial [Patescibacteria group bacterium]|nr:LCP family protein [Patescibacteria group bacterium]